MNHELSRGQDRNRRISYSFAASVFTKAITIGTMLLSVPLAFEVLGKEQFSLWVTITSLLAALQFADLGIGNGLLNLVAVANARDQKVEARRAVTSSFGILVLISVVVFLLFNCIKSYVGWQGLYNVGSPGLGDEAEAATAIMVICLCINLPLQTAQRVQMGYQDGLKANVWISLGALFSLAGVLLCNFLKAGLEGFILATLGGQIVSVALCWIYEFYITRPWLMPTYRYFDPMIGKQIVKDGSLWTLFSFIAFIGTGLDNIIISYFFGAEAVGNYAIMSKLLTGLLVAQMLSAPLWPAFVEAIERKDLVWARRAFSLCIIICGLLGLLGALIIFFLAPSIIRWWVGEEMIPNTSMIIGFAAWSFITNFFAAVAALMANRSMLPTLTRLTAIAALISIGFKVLFAPELGVDFVVWGNVIGYGLICLPGIWICYSRLFDQ